MKGTFPVLGSLTMESLAATLTKEEQLGLAQVTNLCIDTTQQRNLVTLVDQPNQLGTLTVVAQGAACAGTKVTSATVYVCGAKTAVDVYRAS